MVEQYIIERVLADLKVDRALPRFKHIKIDTPSSRFGLDFSKLLPIPAKGKSRTK